MRSILKTNFGNRQRGVTMLGLMALAALLAMWCAIILDRSSDTYRAGAMLEWRLQARAAARGEMRQRPVSHFRGYGHEWAFLFHAYRTPSPGFQVSGFRFQEDPVLP